MILVLVASLMMYSVASSDILRFEEKQALGTDDPPFNSEEKSSQLEDLPLYQPTMADVLDLMKHPPTTLAAPYMEPDGMNDEYSTVYKVRGHYDTRMREINKHAKERKNSGTQKNHASKVGAKDSTYSTTSDVDKTFPVRTHRIAGLKRPARPQRERRRDVRRRGVLESHPDFDRRHSGERPSYEPRPERIPRSKRPVWQPDDSGAPRGARRGTRRRDTHSGNVDRTTTPMAPVEASPPFSTELNHGVKIVSEPGARRPRQGPPPKPEVLSSLPRSGIPRGAGPKATGVNDDPTSVHMTEALAEEPALPYDKVVDEDTTEAVDVSRLVEENAFDRRLRKLEEQQELAETKMLLDDGDEPDPNLSPVEDDSSDGGNEEKNVSAIEQEPQINSPVAPQKPIAAAEDDQMVEVEDLGYELATKRNTSSSQGRMLVPIVDDYFDTNELANTTANATAEFPHDIGGDITDKETANATLTDVKMKRRKYSIASRVWFGNESLYVERTNTTNSSDPLQGGQSVGSKWRPKNRNNSKEVRSSSFVQFQFRKRRYRRRDVTIAKSANDTLDVKQTNETRASSKVVTAVPPKISRDVSTAKLTMTNSTQNLRRKNFTNANRTVLTTMSLNRTRGVGTKKPRMKNCARKLGEEKFTSENGTGLTTARPSKRRRGGTKKFRLESNVGIIFVTNLTSENNDTVSPVEADGAGGKKEGDKSNDTSAIWVSINGKREKKVGFKQAATAKSAVVELPNKTAFSESINYSDPLIEIGESQTSSNCTMILPKNHPPLTGPTDTVDIVSQLKYFENKVLPRLPNETKTPQQLLITVTKLRSHIIQSQLPRWSIDSDYFRKAGVMSRLFPQSKLGVLVKFMFYSRNNSVGPVTLQHDAMSLQSVSLHPESKLQVICHDFEQCASDRWVKQLKEALLNEAEDNNVLVVGWRQAASRNYWTAVANTRPVGRKLACLLRRLRDERGLRLRNVHLVGLGLGAHVARYAAISVVHKLCERVGRVTGLDVSAPLFEEFGETLNAAVAEYVDLVHTSADFVDGLRGQIAATGHVDYYAPGVFSPKSCAVARRDLQRDCNHALSAELFVHSVRDGCGYRSTSCEFWTTKETCSGCGPRGCGHMGFISPLANGTGAQFLTTHAPTLYCENQLSELTQ
ncbi:uncharacterized protein LOC142767284 [Rhipicephalus microplus]|uniref:uncharacterized protein LOC142767284 n=1 Tax=Rhipicephalus microplus TaxID=6941 RepID=UPI003F6BAF98